MKSTAETLHHHYQREFERLHLPAENSRKNGIYNLRVQALNEFKKLGFPYPKQEAWKYTNVEAIEKVSYSANPSNSIARAEILSFLLPEENFCQMVFTNGYFNSELSQLHHLPDGIKILNLVDAIEENPEFLETYLGKTNKNFPNGFNALNTALMTDGVVLVIPPQTKIEKTIHLLFITQSEEENFATHPRNLIIVGESSELKIVENYLSLCNTSYFTNAVTEIFLKENSTLDYCKIQQENTSAFHIGTTEVKQERNSTFNSFAYAGGGKLLRNDINVFLEESASCHLNGLYLTDGRQHLDQHTRIEHIKPRGRSRQFYKGILNGYSRAVFNGQVYVHPDAIKTDTQQTNKNLLLSQYAEIDSKPELEIYNDDIKCTHGATVGQLDEEALFFLRSRGIAGESARAILTYAFAREMLQDLEPALKIYLERLILKQIPNGKMIQEFIWT